MSTIGDITCPHCGHQWRPSEYLMAHWIRIYPENVGPELCRGCGGVYKIDLMLSVSFEVTPCPHKTTGEKRNLPQHGADEKKR